MKLGSFIFFKKAKDFLKFMRFLMGNGQVIHFWEDVWGYSIRCFP